MHAPVACSAHQPCLQIFQNRRQGLARKLMDLLEEATHKLHNGFFVDLFVRQSNANAIGMYHKASKACCMRTNAIMPL